MEGIGSFLDDEEWDSLSKLLSIEEDSDNFMLHLNGNSLFPSAAADYNESNLFIPSHTLDYIFNSTSQESSNSSEIGSALFSNKSKENHLANGANFHHDHTNNSLDQSMNFYAMDREINTSTMPVFPDDVMEEIFQLKGELCKAQKSNAKIHPSETEDSCKEVQLKRKYKASGAQTRQDKPEDHSSASPKKKPRVSRDVSKNKRNVRSKKMKKSDQNISNEEENNSRGIANSSSTSTSEDDFINDSEELNSKEETIASRGSQLNSNGKERASRGSANDPQSLYARKRRERINERLKILQNLIPNGTKVDISTMLEEAVHYVKFLQLQIKLLSSDDHWMYAPIAYNGMDMGFYQKIVSNLCIQN